MFRRAWENHLRSVERSEFLRSPDFSFSFGKIWIKTTSRSVCVFIQWAASVELSLVDLPGLYATDTKSTSRLPAGSSSAGSEPRGGEKSHITTVLPSAWLHLSVIVVMFWLSARFRLAHGLNHAPNAWRVYFQPNEPSLPGVNETRWP